MVRVKTHKESRHVKIHPPVGRGVNCAILYPIKKKVLSGGRGVVFLWAFSMLSGVNGKCGVCSLTSFFHRQDHSA